MIRSFRSRALRRFWERSDASGLRPDWVGKVDRILSRLDSVVAPEHMDVPGFGFHALRGDRRGRYAVVVSRNWRITFGWSDGDGVDIDLEDYHGG